MILHLRPPQINIPKIPKRKKLSPEGSGQRRPRARDKRHLMAVAGLPSVISGKIPCQACHIRYADVRYNKRSTGLAEKPDDRWVLPMTPDEHAQQHAGNEQAFWYVRGIDPTALANVLYKVWNTTTDPYAAQEIMRQVLARVRT